MLIEVNYYDYAIIFIRYVYINQSNPRLIISIYVVKLVQRRRMHRRDAQEEAANFFGRETLLCL